MPLHFVLSQKGSKLLHHEGYLFNKLRVCEPDKHYKWRCIEYSNAQHKCNCIANTSSMDKTGVLLNVGDHSHLADAANVNARKVINKMKKKAIQNTAKPSVILKSEIAHTSTSVKAQLPNNEALRKTIIRTRNHTFDELKTPKTLAELEIPERYQQTVNNKRFLFYDSQEIAKIGEGKKILFLEYIIEEQLVVVLSGKQRHVRLVPIRALDGDEVEWIKVAETKGCITIAIGVMRKNPLTYCLCVAIKKQNASQIIIYEITRTKTRHKRIRDMVLPCQVQTLQILSESRICVGYPSGFSMYSILGDYHPLSLIHPENTLLGFLTYSNLDALICIEVSKEEFLLAFHTLAVYVDNHGRKSRDREIMYPAVPTAVCHFEGFLLVYSETHIDIFNCMTGDWLQTMNIKRARPLNLAGSLTTCSINDMQHVIFICSLQQREMINLILFDTNGRLITQAKRRFSLREGNRTNRTFDRRSKMISAPTNFNHISHMGPGNGIQIQRLLDLPTTLETADQQIFNSFYNNSLNVHTSEQPRVHNVSTAHVLNVLPTQQLAHTFMETRGISSNIANNSGFSTQNGAVSSKRSVAHIRSSGTPPSLPHTPIDLTDNDVLHVRSSTPLSLGNIRPFLEKDNTSGSPRNSITSNNSSNLSSPPSPVQDHGSSSYDS